MKSLIILIIFAASAILIACGGTQPQTNNAVNANPSNTNASNNSAAANSGSTRNYPKSTADAFLESCEEAGSDAAFCTCVFAKVQAKYTFEEFSVIESKLMAGKPPEEFVEFTGRARAECTK